MLNQLFLDHPRSVGETYLVHQRKAFGFGLSMILGGLACLVHGLIPALFLRTGSSTISRLYRCMVTNRTATGSPGGFPSRS